MLLLDAGPLAPPPGICGVCLSRTSCLLLSRVRMPSGEIPTSLTGDSPLSPLSAKFNRTRTGSTGVSDGFCVTRWRSLSFCTLSVMFGIARTLADPAPSRRWPQNTHLFNLDVVSHWRFSTLRCGANDCKTDSPWDLHLWRHHGCAFPRPVLVLIVAAAEQQWALGQWSPQVSCCQEFHHLEMHSASLPYLLTNPFAV
jgi:hypothetical protein